jgi:hypothetical protein
MRRAKASRGIFERPAGSGIWWVRYRDEHGRLHREKVGPKGLAKKVYAKRKTEIAEARFFPEKLRRAPESLPAAIKKYVARRRSTIIAVDDFERYGQLWATARETARRTTHDLTAEDIEDVREPAGRGLRRLDVEQGSQLAPRLLPRSARGDPQAAGAPHGARLPGEPQALLRGRQQPHALSDRRRGDRAPRRPA